jgi:hypothetical protein
MRAPGCGVNQAAVTVCPSQHYRLPLERPREEPDSAMSISQLILTQPLRRGSRLCRDAPSNSGAVHVVGLGGGEDEGVPTQEVGVLEGEFTQLSVNFR